MEIIDLRIGNLIQTISEEPQIIKVEKIDGVEKTVSGSGLEDISIEDLTGVPLTEDYFLQNGFIKQEGKNIKYIHKETKFEMFINEKERLFMHSIHKDDGIETYGFYYVHRIQNFYFQKNSIEISNERQYYYATNRELNERSD